VQISSAISSSLFFFFEFFSFFNYCDKMHYIDILLCFIPVSSLPIRKAAEFYRSSSTAFFPVDVKSLRN